MKLLREQLTAARKEKKMTQEQLARRLNVARATISNWENGRSQPDIQALRMLTDVLDCDFLAHHDTATSSDSAKARKLRLHMTESPMVEVISGANACELSAGTVDFRINGRDRHGNAVEIHAFAEFSVISEDK